MNTVQKLVMAQRELIKHIYPSIRHCEICRELKERVTKLERKIIEEETIKEDLASYCAKCAAKMKAKEGRYICMNPECDDYLKVKDE